MGGFVIFRILPFPFSQRELHIPLQASALLKGDDVTAPPVALNRSALRLAGHQSPRQDCFSGDEPAGGILIKWLCGDGAQG